jgi:hypothetical protein
VAQASAGSTGAQYGPLLQALQDLAAELVDLAIERMLAAVTAPRVTRLGASGTWQVGMSGMHVHMDAGQPQPQPPQPQPQPGGGGASEQPAVAGAQLASAAPAGTCCVVCLDAPRDTLLLPCKHMVLCGGCFARMAVEAARTEWGLYAPASQGSVPRAAAAAASVAAAVAYSETDIWTLAVEDDEVLQLLLGPSHSPSSVQVPSGSSGSGGAAAAGAAGAGGSGGSSSTPFAAAAAPPFGAGSSAVTEWGRLMAAALRCPVCRTHVSHSVSGVLLV